MDTDKLIEYHYNAYKNLIKISLFLNAAGVTAVMATLSLKYNHNQAGDPCKVASFVNMNSPVDLAINSALNCFLFSIAMMLVCVIIEYISYFPRRKKQNSHNINKSNCCFCDSFIKTSTFIMYTTLALSILSLSLGGFRFLNIPLQ